MLVHRGWGRDEVVLVDLVRQMTGQGTVHPVHRIDRGASGVVLFARCAEIVALLQERFGDGRVKKRYFAVVRGVAPDSGEIDHPIPRREGGPRVEAQTAFRRLAWAETEPRHVSLVEAIPRTGRLHQVRRHLKHIDHPVIGDANYGKGRINRAMAECYGLRRLALHAVSLELVHPITEEKVYVEAPIPPDLADPLASMGLG